MSKVSLKNLILLYEREKCAEICRSINCGFLAAKAQDFRHAAKALYELWARITPNDVFLTDTLTLTRIGLNWMADLSLGGWVGSGCGKSLLITSSLRKLLETNIDTGVLIANLRSGLIGIQRYDGEKGAVDTISDSVIRASCLSLRTVVFLKKGPGRQKDPCC